MGSFNRISLFKFCLMVGILILPVFVQADDNPYDELIKQADKHAAGDDFEMPKACAAKGLDIEVAVPCDKAATKKLFMGKNMGVSFTGPGGKVFRLPKTDKLGESDNPYDDSCVGSYLIKNPAQIKSILLGKSKPIATVAPGDGRWYHFAGLPVAADKPEGSSMETDFDTDGDECTVSFTMAKTSTTADLSAAQAQCMAEFDKDHVVNRSTGQTGTLATNNKATDRSTMVGACRDAVTHLAQMAGASPIECHKTLGAGEQADPTKSDSTSIAFMCRSRTNPNLESPIALKQVTDNTGSVTGNSATALPARDIRKEPEDFNP
jgi:hypothetical protein